MTNTYSESSWVRASGQYGWVGIEIFFVISGFIIPYALFKGGYTAKKNWVTFLSKRIIRIEPSYLLAVLVALTLWHVSSMIPGFQGQLAPNLLSNEVLLHLGYLNGIFDYPWLNPVFWTLAIEFQFYLLISIIFGLISSRNFVLLVFIDCMLLLASLLLNSDVFVFHYLGLFLFGIVTFQYRLGFMNKITLMVFLIAISFFVSFNHSVIVSMAGLTTSVILLSNTNIGQSRLPLMLGSISYSLYLLHIPIGGRIVNFGKRYLETQIGEFLLSIIAVLVSIVAAYLFYRLIEKPSQILASKYKYSRKL